MASRILHKVNTTIASINIDFTTSRDRSHKIVFANLSGFPAAIADAGLAIGNCVVVSDSNVARLYGEAVVRSLTSAGWSVESIVIPAGEQSKSLTQLESVLHKALTAGVDRSSPIVAVGGGVVGDLAGFAAATLMRGVPLVHVPTSLVAQIDSCIGGKTGVNSPLGKNLIGAFHQPSLIFVDTDTLTSLPETQWLSGLSEVVKSALVFDAGFFRFLVDSWPLIIDRDAGVIREMVYRCAQIKVDIVTQDEHESGLRAILNFGHTFGHAIERVLAYRGLSHGAAVAVGMRAALHLTALRNPGVDFGPAVSLVGELLSLPEGTTVSIDSLTQAMNTDKKRRNDRLHFVLLDEIGAASVVGDVTPEEVRGAWMNALEPHA